MEGTWSVSGKLFDTLIRLSSNEESHYLIGAQVILLFVAALFACRSTSEYKEGETKESSRIYQRKSSNIAAKIVTVLLVFTTSISLWSTYYTQPHNHDDAVSYPPRLAQSTTIPNLFKTSIVELQAGLESRLYTSEDLVEAYLARIEEVNSVLHAVIETAPIDKLRTEAKAFDQERAQLKTRGYLHGIPILVKDNVATDVSYGLNTTAGSFALLNSVPISDAQIVSQLRKGGAIIIGKSNMSVWAQARGNLTQGWSPRGGYTSSAYLLHGNPCSSSSGAGVATSVGLAAASIGTETDGSIICPASRNGVVGMKPTVGLASRFGVIPISSSQDTTGPIVQSVSDAAIILTSIMTPKSNIKHVWLDSALASQPEKVSKGINYAKNLFDLRLEEKEEPLKGIRIGVLGGHLLDLELNEIDSEIVDIYYEALNQLKGAGATLVNVSLSITTDADQMSVLNNNRNDVIFAEYQESMNKYLSFLKHIPSGIYNFAGLIDFANKHPDLELPEGETDQAVFVDTLYRPLYAPTQITDEGVKRITYNKTYISGQRVIKEAETEIGKVMKKNRLTTLVGPSESYLFSLAAKIGYPSISVPSGFLRSSGVQANPKVRPIWPFNGAPTGLCLVAAKWEEETLLKVARGFEVMQIRTGRGGYDGKVRTFKAATPTTQLQDILQKEI